MGYSGNVIHVVADKWLTPSIKNIEHIDQDAYRLHIKLVDYPKKDQLIGQWP